MTRSKDDVRKFEVKIDRGYTPDQRQAIALDIIEFVIKRTQNKKLDKDNIPFQSGYSKSYAKSVEGRAAGKRSGAKPNLNLTGEMLNTLQLLKNEKGKLTIGYKRGDEVVDRVMGNVLGTYGRKTPIKGKARDFMGIHPDDVEKITNKYPLDQPEEIAKRIALAKEALAGAEDFIERGIILEDF